MAVLAAFERYVFGSRHDFFISDFFAIFSVTPIKSIFNVSRWRRVNLFYDLGMGVARDSHRRCIYYPEHVYTLEGYSNRSVSSCVCVSVCLSVCVSPVNS